MNSSIEKSNIDYTGNIIYEGNEISYIITAEGRLTYNDELGIFNYEYYLQDHLGNNRVVFNQDNQVLQTNSYYPFGMNIESLTTNNQTLSPKNLYLYNGKELQTDFGLDWHDYGARFYDAQIGRWHVIDPLAESYYSWSPYNYTMNNPIMYIDPNGMYVVTTDSTKATNATNGIFENNQEIADFFYYEQTKDGNYKLMTKGNASDLNKLLGEGDEDLRALATGLYNVSVMPDAEYNLIFNSESAPVCAFDNKSTDDLLKFDVNISLNTPTTDFTNNEGNNINIKITDKSEILVHELLGEGPQQYEVLRKNWHRRQNFTGSGMYKAVQTTNIYRRYKDKGYYRARTHSMGDRNPNDIPEFHKKFNIY